MTASTLKPASSSLKVFNPTEEDILRQIGQWGVLPEYQPWTLSQFALDGAPSWDQRGFFLSGPTGSGKSCLAAALLRDRMRPEHPQTLAQSDGAAFTEHGGKRVEGSSYRYNFGRGVAWHYGPSLPRLVMDSWGKEGEEAMFQKILRPMLIIIDDLGTEKPTEHTIPIMGEIVDRVINGHQDMIVTSNLSLSELSKRDVRLASRLSMLTAIELPERDMRLSERKKRRTIKATIRDDKNADV